LGGQDELLRVRRRSDFYEHLITTGVLCDANCNIRVDLVLFIPILLAATFCAYQGYMGRPGQLNVLAWFSAESGYLFSGSRWRAMVTRIQRS